VRNDACEERGALTRDSPRSDDLDIWFEAIEGHLEADLVVSFASAAMGDEP
jgi:hypothetical protein